MNIFKNLMYLGSQDQTWPRNVGAEDHAFGPTYGNRVAFERRFNIHYPTRPGRSRRVGPAALAGQCGCG